MVIRYGEHIEIFEGHDGYYYWYREAWSVPTSDPVGPFNDIWALLEAVEADEVKPDEEREANS